MMLLPGYNRKMAVENPTRSVLLMRTIATVFALAFAFGLTFAARAIGISPLELLAVLFVPFLLGQTALNAWRRRQS